MTSVEQICLHAYEETRHFGPIESLCREESMGFEILLGPPYKNAPIAFIGYQPGDWQMTPAEARAGGYEDGWVTRECQFASAPWALAKRLRNIFPQEVLKRCVGLNAVFVRAKSISHYRAKVGLSDRRCIRNFCLGQVRTLLEAIEPRNLIAIGLDTLALFSGGEPSLKNDRGRVLAKRGLIFGRQAHAVLHLTGARINTSDRRKIAEYLQSELAPVFPTRA